MLIGLARGGLGEQPLVMSIGIVASRADVHHALGNSLSHSLGYWSILKDRFIGKAEVVHDHVRSSRRQFLNCGNKIQAGRKASAEQQVRAWRQIINDFRYCPTLIEGTTHCAAVLAVNDGEIC